MTHEQLPETVLPEEDEAAIPEMLRSIEEQGRQTLELVRTLVALLLPKEGGREGPSLEDLLAAMLAQQRDLVATVRTIRTDVRAIDDRLAGRTDTRAATNEAGVLSS